MLYQLTVLHKVLFQAFYFFHPAIDHFYLSTTTLYYLLDQLLDVCLEFHLIQVLVLEVVHLQFLDLNLGLLYHRHLYL